MASEIGKKDENRVTTLMGVTDDGDAFIKRLLVDAATGRLKVTGIITAGAGITSLGGLTADTQTFADDTNITMSSATSTHTLGWTGTLAVARGGTGSGTASGARTNLGLVIGTDVQAEDPVLTDIAALAAVADNEFIVGTGAGTYAHESGATARTSMGAGTGDGDLLASNNLSDVALASTARTNLGLGNIATETIGALTTSLISDTDITDDLGTGDVRWRDIYTSTLRSGLTAADTLLLQARDVDGTAWVTFATLTSANVPTMDLATAVTRGGNTILDDTSTASALTSLGTLTSLALSGDITFDAGATRIIKVDTDNTRGDDLLIFAGSGGTGDVAGGLLDIGGGAGGTGGNNVGGAVLISGGQDSGLGIGGAVIIRGGIGDTNGSVDIGDVNTLIVNIGTTLAMGANDITLTGATGRDTDNELNWGTDDSLAIVIGGVTSNIVSISTGAGDNDKLVTQGYVDDAGGGGGVSIAMTVSTIFEESLRYQVSNTGTGSNSFNNTGVDQTTGTSAGGFARVAWRIVGLTNVKIFLGSPMFTCVIGINTHGTTASSFYGLGDITVDSTGHTYTENHAGFKIVLVSSTGNLYATQADGTTETESASLVGTALNDVFDLILKMNDTSSVDYYWRKNSGALSGATNLSTNMPSQNTEKAHFSISNQSTASRTRIAVGGASLTR